MSHEHVPASVPSYSEESLASVIIENFKKFTVLSDVLDFLEIFNIDHKVNVRIAEFVMKNIKDDSVTSDCADEEDPDSSDDSEKEFSDEAAATDSSEYYDTE